MEIEGIEGVRDHARDEQIAGVLVVGGHDVPRRALTAGGADAFLIRLAVLLPEFALLDIGNTEFPVFVRIINSVEKAFSLFVFR